jgi:hypothetical protein
MSHMRLTVDFAENFRCYSRLRSGLLDRYDSSDLPQVTETQLPLTHASLLPWSQTETPNIRIRASAWPRVLSMPLAWHSRS